MSSYVVTTPAGASLQITSFPPVVNTIKVVHVRLPKKEGDTLVLLRGFSFFAIKAPFIISCKRLLLFVVVECPWSDESYKRIVMPQISISFFGGVMLSFQRKKISSFQRLQQQFKLRQHIDHLELKILLLADTGSAIQRGSRTVLMMSTSVTNSEYFQRQFFRRDSNCQELQLPESSTIPKKVNKVGTTYVNPKFISLPMQIWWWWCCWSQFPCQNSWEEIQQHACLWIHFQSKNLNLRNDSRNNQRYFVEKLGCWLIFKDKAKTLWLSKQNVIA